jgi:hypothetical protein
MKKAEWPVPVRSVESPSEYSEDGAENTADHTEDCPENSADHAEYKPENSTHNTKADGNYHNADQHDK